jgi:hypothetical protein
MLLEGILTKFGTNYVHLAEPMSILFMHPSERPRKEVALEILAP